MTDPRVIPIAIAVTFPGQAVTGANIYRSLICDPNGAGWVSLADPVTGNPVATVTIPDNVTSGSSAIVAASGVYAKATQAGNDELQVVDSIIVTGEGVISPAISTLTGLAGASAIMLADPSSANFATARGFRPDGASIAADLDVAAFVGGLSLAYGYDLASASWIPSSMASAPNLATLDGLGAQLTTRPGEWTITDAPAANTVATATRAAGAAGVRHVLTSFCADLCAVAAQATPITFVIRDGAAGVGAILYQRRLIAPLGTTASVEITDLNIVGSDATAMTVECTAAPAATNFATVSASGYSVSAPPVAPVDGINITIGEHPTSPGVFGYGDASNGNFGAINSGSFPFPGFALVSYRENEFNGVGIRVQGDSAAPAANEFTSFSLYDDSQTLVLGPILFADAGFTGISGTRTREWSYDDLGSTPLHTIGLGGTFTIVVE